MFSVFRIASAGYPARKRTVATAMDGPRRRVGGCAHRLVCAFGLCRTNTSPRAHIFIQTETILEPVLNGFTARPNYQQRVEVMRLQLLTRPNIEEVIYRAGLSDSIDEQSTVERRARMEAMIGWLTEAIKIESPRDMYFVISFKHSDSEVSRSVVDAVLNMLIEQDLGASLSENQAARRRLNLQIEEYEEKLSRSERRTAAFRRDHAAELGVSQGTARRREQRENDLARVGEELAAAKGRELTLKNLLSATPTTSSGDELDKLKVELAGLRSKYRENHPDIRRRCCADQAA